jgi:transcriptional regulator with XRE-family HTH domain|nr:helix-turn-helix transcriptional regulator [uncultured Anaerocolumna sp.]
MYEIFEQLLQKHGITTYKVSKDTGISQTTFSNWKSGRSTPKQDKMQILADYFGVTVDYLLGIEKDENVQYYLNDETREIAQEIFENKDLRILFDASRKAKPDDLKLIIEMAKRFKGED